MNGEPNKQMMVSVTSWGWTSKGHAREDNQDSFLNWPERLVWAVADGVGQSVDGAMASNTTVQHLLQMPPANSMNTKVQDVKEALRNANEELWQRRTAEQICASTVAVLIMDGGQASCIWSGDSRCYLLRKGTLYQCTKDHTLRQKTIDEGRLSVPEAHRMIRGHIIVKAIGGQDQADLEEVTFRLEPDDRFLLCTDGLSGTLSHDMLCEALRRGPDARSTSARLEDMVQARTQKDNLTQITIFVSGV